MRLQCGALNSEFVYSVSPSQLLGCKIHISNFRWHLSYSILHQSIITQESSNWKIEEICTLTYPLQRKHVCSLQSRARCPPRPHRWHGPALPMSFSSHLQTLTSKLHHLPATNHRNSETNNGASHRRRCQTADAWCECERARGGSAGAP